VQSIKGADILAYDYPELPDNAGQFKVFMPDFWGDHPQDLENFPPKTPKQLKKIVDFMTGPADPDKTVPLIAPLLEAFQKKNPQIKTWSILGFCWGVKIAALVTTKGTQFKAAAGGHPSLMDVEDAKHVTVPFCVLPSQDEDPEVCIPRVSPFGNWTCIARPDMWCMCAFLLTWDAVYRSLVRKYQKGLPAKLHGDIRGPSPRVDDLAVSFDTLPRKPRCVMVVLTDRVLRADFNDLHCYSEYLRGYRIVRTFFAAHM
jgi:hypothetical protein